MLEMRHVYTRYGQVECLKGINFKVHENEIVALLGANGAGKSTVLKTLSGLVRPTAGEVLFQGKKISTLSPEAIVRAGISHVPEGRKIFQKLTVLENLALGAYTKRDPTQIKKDMDSNFELFPILKNRRHQKAGTLSGGEQQMLALARALMARPSVLLLDEPSLGLAPIFVSTIFKMIETIHRQGKTILIVEQNASMALKIASRAYVLEIGQIVLEGDANTVKSSAAVQEAYLGGS